MVTISVISILILIFSVTVILGFLWYTRNLLNRKCGCSNLHEPSSTDVIRSTSCHWRKWRWTRCWTRGARATCSCS